MLLFDTSMQCDKIEWQGVIAYRHKMGRGVVG